MRYLRVSNSERRHFRRGAYSLASRHFRIAQRRTERWRKSRVCAEACIGTPHKKTRRLIPPWRDQGGKRALSGWKLAPICFTQHKTGYNIIASQIAGFIADRKVGVAHVQQMNMNPYPVNITAGSAPALSLYICSSNITI
jgi:hypothetical protein